MGTRLYVGNIPYSTSDGDLRTLFGQNGRTVTEVKIVIDRVTGQSRGFAFVEMASADEAQAAITELNGSSVGGRSIVVNEARERTPGGGGGGGRSFGGGPGGGGGGAGPRSFGPRPGGGGGGYAGGGPPRSGYGAGAPAGGPGYRNAPPAQEKDAGRRRNRDRDRERERIRDEDDDY